jgi:hypothetical protein
MVKTVSKVDNVRNSTAIFARVAQIVKEYYLGQESQKEIDTDVGKEKG